MCSCLPAKTPLKPNGKNPPSFDQFSPLAVYNPAAIIKTITNKLMVVKQVLTNAEYLTPIPEEKMCVICKKIMLDDNYFKLNIKAQFNAFE